MTEARINARLDPESARKLTALKQRTGLSTSEIIREALDKLHDDLSRGQGSAATILQDSGFIGCAKGAEDLSTSYKRSQGASLRRKTA